MPSQNENDARTLKWDVKELREWGTFILSFIAVPSIALAGVWLKGQRMEIEQAIAAKYVSKEAYSSDKASFEAADRAAWAKIGETNAKIEEIRIQSATTLQTVLDLKDEFKQKDHHL